MTPTERKVSWFRLVHLVCLHWSGKWLCFMTIQLYQYIPWKANHVTKKATMLTLKKPTILNLLLLANLTLYFLNFLKIANKEKKAKVQLGKTWLTLFKTDSTRAGCLACQNKNPRTTRWKISFSGFRIKFRPADSSGSMVSSFGFPNCPAELSNATPTTWSGNASAVSKAVNPPRLKKVTFCYMVINFNIISKENFHSYHIPDGNIIQNIRMSCKI